MKRASGVLMHISSLWGEYSCGSFGKSAREFIDFLQDSGFSYWQTLPLGLTDEWNSPYKSYSAFAGNPWFIDLESLFEKGLLTSAQLDSARQRTAFLCEFERLRTERLELLLSASKRMADREAVEDFIESRPYLAKFCEFMALKTANHHLPWNEWTTGRYDSDTLFLWKFIQYEFFTQWQEVQNYAGEHGIQIIGDIPFYVAYDSCDVWSNRDLFELDAQGREKAMAGVPPDYFSADGQLWGNPLYNWETLRKTGYRWWKDRVAHQFSLFDAVRMDHFRGIESFWRVEAGETTAKNGKWVKGPGEELVNAIRSVAGDRLIIAEDLGEITPEVKQLLEKSGFPGMRVFQFAFLGGDNPHLPHHYQKNCVAYSGTHDNNTLLGYLWELDGNTRKQMLDYCGFSGDDWGRGLDAVIRTLFASSAGLLILPIQDILGFGSDTRMNIPGKAEGNWTYRVTKEQFGRIDRARWLHLNHLYRRK